MTIHNLAFQGLFDGDLTALLGLPREVFGIEGIEYHGRTSFLKAGLMFADRLSTVSPTYAKEILHSPLGMGLEGVLAKRRDRLTGILNGIDDSVWNPASDPALDTNYDARTIAAKVSNKAALQRAWPRGPPERPLFGVVAVLTPQKDPISLHSLPDAAALPDKLAVSGPRAARSRTCARRRRACPPGLVATTSPSTMRLAHRVERERTSS